MAKYADNFERADADALGQSWVESESNPATMRVLSSKINLQADIGGVAQGAFAYWDAVYGANQFSQMRRGSRGFLNTNLLIVRGSGTFSNFTGYAAEGLEISIFTISVEIVRYEGFNLQTGATGTRTVLGDVLLNESFKTPASLIAMVLGSALTAAILDADGIEVRRVQVTDSIIASGKAGIAVAGVVGVEVFDFDNWRGGDAAAVAWALNDSFPVLLAMQFDPAAAPWTDKWWGAFATMHFPDVTPTTVVKDPIRAGVIPFPR